MASDLSSSFYRSLPAKAIVRFARHVVFLSLFLFLFLPAGSWDFWQAWVFLIQFCAFKENTNASAGVTTVPKQKVISTGPYAAVRHPMYSGALLVDCAMPIALGSWWGLPFALAMLIVIILRLLDEEMLLQQSLPGYEEYC